MIGISTNLIDPFLQKYPLMSLKPSSKKYWNIQGKVNLNIDDNNYGKVIDQFTLLLSVPKNFPSSLPKIFELEERIPKEADHHVFMDGSLCLGSRLTLKKTLKEDPTIEGFMGNCVIPYLFSMSLYLEEGKSFIFGELEHNYIGIINEYKEIFDLEDVYQVLDVIDILSMKKRVGNKQLCPCGCNRKVTLCNTHKKINKYRNVLNREELENEKKEIIALLNRAHLEIARERLLQIKLKGDSK